MYRNEWEAAVARATALENELRIAQQSQVQDHNQIANLTQQLQMARAELARLQAGVQPQYQYGYAPMPSYMYAPRAGTILVFGILSLVVCSILGPVAWVMGNEELRRIDSGQTSPEGRSNVQTGRILGIVTSVLLMVAVLFIVFALILVAGESSHHRY